MVESTLTGIDRVTKKAVIGAIKAAGKTGTDMNRTTKEAFAGAIETGDAIGTRAS